MLYVSENTRRSIHLIFIYFYYIARYCSFRVNNNKTIFGKWHTQKRKKAMRNKTKVLRKRTRGQGIEEENLHAPEHTECGIKTRQGYLSVSPLCSRVCVCVWCLKQSLHFAYFLMKRKKNHIIYVFGFFSLAFHFQSSLNRIFGCCFTTVPYPFHSIRSVRLVCAFMKQWECFFLFWFGKGDKWWNNSKSKKN